MWCLTSGLMISLILHAAVCVQAGNTSLNVVPGVRVSGPLPISLQHEVDAAIDRGRIWLATRQATDGSWQGSNRVALTALGWLVLTTDTTPATTAVVARAWIWLEQQTNTDACVCLRLVRAVHANDTAGADRAFLDLRTNWNSVAKPTIISDDLLWQWQIVWLQNRASTGSANNQSSPAPSDWRANIARQIISTQLVAPEQPGAGFWHALNTNPTDWRSDPVARTCFALLALQEL